MNSNKVELNKLTLDEKEKSVIDYLGRFFNVHSDELIKHYFSVIDKDSGGRKQWATEEIYQLISEDEYKAELLKVSVVILTANPFEREVLNCNVYFDNNTKIKNLEEGINPFKKSDFHVVDPYIFEINGYTVLHLYAPETGSNTPCGSTDLVRYVSLNPYLKPKCIISFGVCFGINWLEQNIGDTIIAEKVYPWSIGIKINKNSWEIKHDDYIIDLRQNSPQLYNKINRVVTGKKNDNKNIVTNNVLMGNVLTGEAVVNNETAKLEAIENSYTCKIIGGEMEGYGLSKECVYYLDTPCLIIKAICDWGVCKNIDEKLFDLIPKESRFDCKGQLQAFAAYNAYLVLKKLFFENVFSPSSVLRDAIDIIMKTYGSDQTVRYSCLKEFLLDYINCYISDKQIYFNKSLVEEICEIIILQLENFKSFEKVVNDGITSYLLI